MPYKNHDDVLAAKSRYYQQQSSKAYEIAVLDFETDPFDPLNNVSVYPFCYVLYLGADKSPITAWNNDYKLLVADLYRNIETLSGRYIIYAHNGGNFDYRYLLHLLRGKISLKGRAIMSAHIGKHELRDSMHIMPGKLRDVAGKDDFDYRKMQRTKREKYREQIFAYCLSDCKYLYDRLLGFHKHFGKPLTIGQAAMKELKSKYEFECLSDNTDQFMRKWFQGGRVDCLRYGVVKGAYNLLDVNSMYPAVMAKYSHPICRDFFIDNKIGKRTRFITLSCTNDGAFTSRTSTGGLTTRQIEGVFHTTIWEYEIARKYNKIKNVEILHTINFDACSDFSRFVEPLYAERFDIKRKIAEETDPQTRGRLEQQSYFTKLLLNNAYGKFAQNPRRFQDTIILDVNQTPKQGEGYEPKYTTDDYAIWGRPTNEYRFYNVACAASITGAARAVLFDALCCARDPLYCDTDSIICRDVVGDIPIDAYKLGSWKIEAPIDIYIGCGKKLYAYQRPDRTPPNHQVIKSKGMAGVSWSDMLAISRGQKIEKKMLGPTIGLDLSQNYITRQLQLTGV